VIADGLAFVGLPAGRLIALSALSGAPRWEVAVAEPRGATELERVSDVSGSPALMGRDVCASSYQGRIACVDAGNGTLRWARELSAAVGPGIDQRYVFAADEKGNLQAFARETGSNLWRNTSLAWRGLSAPVSFGRAVVVGDRQGYLHFLSREEGAMLARHRWQRHQRRSAGGRLEPDRSDSGWQADGHSFRLADTENELKH